MRGFRGEWGRGREGRAQSAMLDHDNDASGVNGILIIISARKQNQT